MSKAATAASILMGAVFLVTGLNGFFHFLPDPELPPAARAFMGALLVTGIAVLLAPVLVNTLLFHLVLAPAGIVPGLVLSLCALVLARAHWPRFRGLFG